MTPSPTVENREHKTEEILQAILRGAAKILGCNSANLISINEKTQEIRIRIGVLADQFDIVSEVEGLIGATLRNTSLRLVDAKDSLVVASWSDRAVYETSSMAALVGTVFPPETVRQAASLIGEHRFICVPVTSGTRIYGDIVFEKHGTHPFSPQQREVLLRYAQRIGEIIDGDLAAPGPAGMPGRASLHDVNRFLINRRGEIVGHHPGAATHDAGSGPSPKGADQCPIDGALPGETLKELVVEARRFFTGPGVGPEIVRVSLAPPYEAELSPILAFAEMHVLCTIVKSTPRSETSIQDRLLHLALAESAPTVLVDPEFRITSCNGAAVELFGHAAEELLNKDIGTFFWEPAAIRTVLNHQFLFLSNGHYEETAAVRPRDGRALSRRIHALLLADETDKVIGFLVTMRELRSQADAPDDESSIDRLMRQERFATMGEMAAQLAHEIRNPLLAIGATLESLTHDLELDGAKKAVVVSLMNEISRMDMILKDYLSLAARHHAVVSRVALDELLGEVQNLLHGTRRLSGKTIRLDVPAGLDVRADYEGMKHVFFNLLLNALEASPKGGEVVCRVTRRDDSVTVVIEDSGPGFTGDTEKCFEPFHTTKKNGTGLGLAVCRKIVASYGGAITLGNREGGGARVAMDLPQRHPA